MAALWRLSGGLPTRLDHSNYKDPTAASSPSLHFIKSTSKYPGKICLYVLKLLRVKCYSWKPPEAHFYTEVINPLLICLI